MGWEEGDGLVGNNPSKVEPQVPSAEEIAKDPKNQWVISECLSCGIRQRRLCMIHADHGYALCACSGEHLFLS